MGIVKVDYELFASFAFYATLVVVKTMLMSFITVYYRLTKRVVSSPEDYRFGKVKLDDPDVERIRRAHLNDLENIFAFVLIGIFYCTIVQNPDLNCAIWHFRVFAAARILHSISYVFALRQPARGLCFLVGYLVCLSMAFHIFMSTWHLVGIEPL